MRYKFDTDVYAVGDIHGQPGFLKEQVIGRNITNSSFILLGDIGLGFHDNHFGCCRYLNKIGLETNNHFYLFRGNHDNPESYKGDNKKRIEDAFDHVHIMNDFDEVELSSGHVGIIVGGGISIDRQYRIVDKSYWRDETIDYSFTPDRTYDFVLAHSGPTPPKLDPENTFFKNMVSSDTALVDIIKKEQDYIDKFIDSTKPLYWINGHYHIHGSGTFDYKDTKVVVLAEVEELSDELDCDYIVRLKFKE